MTTEQAILALKEKINYYESDKRLKAAIETLIPELRESEDERTRKELIGALMWQRDCLDANGPHDNNSILPGFTMKVGDILRWLEKQKEQKPVDDKAFEEWIDDWYQGSKEAGGDIVMSEAEFKNWSRGIRNMYVEQRPVPIPCGHENGTTTEVCYDPKGDPDPAGVWKPSEEQIYSLGTVVKGSGDCAVGSVGYNLKELYEQLKKLM